VPPLLLTVVAVGAVTAAAQDPLSMLTPDEVAVVEATNAERKAAGLPAFKVSLAMMKLAREHSAHMARLKQLGHDLPGSTFQDRVKASGYPYRRIGENVAEGYPTPKEAVKGWMESPGHKANILNGEFTVIGVGTAAAKDGTKYWTQVFADPFPK
jgi:uncharacterized protein YkwD